MDGINTEELLLRKELSDILLVLDKRKMKIQAVTGIGADGEPQTVDPTKKNQNQFMRVDKSGDVFSNFFSNFFSQLRNPTNFSFFKVTGADAVPIANKMQKHIDNPTVEGERLMKDHEVKTEDYRQDHKILNKTDMEETSKQIKSGEYRYAPEQIDWETMSNLGLSKEKLEKFNVLEPLLKGYKTNELILISLNFGKVISKMDARLSLQPDDKGQLVVAIHGIRKEPQLNFPFFGHEFSKEDKENLLTTGNMGRIVDLKNFKTGETMPSVISVDRLTNELIALKSEYMKIPDEIKGVQLNEEQKQTLKEGKPLYIEVCDLKLEVLHYDFTTRGCKVIQEGWRTIKGDFSGDKTNIIQELPELKVNDELKIKETVVAGKKTQPPKLYTEAGLLSTMETAGKELKIKEESKALQNIGIGTPATRSVIIETLLARDYIVREKKSLIPTEKGLMVYNLVKNMKIADVAMTAKWELAFQKIENGEEKAERFQKEMETYASVVTNELLQTNIIRNNVSQLICPKCKKEHLAIRDRIVKCPDAECNWMQFRQICGVKLSLSDIESLVNKRKTSLIKGFISNSGKKFNAFIVLNDEAESLFDFEK